MISSIFLYALLPHASNAKLDCYLLPWYSISQMYSLVYLSWLVYVMTLLSIYYALLLYACNDILFVKGIKLFLYRYHILVYIFIWHDSYVLDVVTPCLVLSLLKLKYSYGSIYFIVYVNLMCCGV